MSSDFTKFIEYNKSIRILGENAMKIFGERLLELRKEKGVSQAKLAKDLGVSYSVVCYWETNRSEPTAPNLVKIADYFGVSVDFLLGRVDY